MGTGGSLPPAALEIRFPLYETTILWGTGIDRRSRLREQGHLPQESVRAFGVERSGREKVALPACGNGYAGVSKRRITYAGTGIESGWLC